MKLVTLMILSLLMTFSCSSRPHKNKHHHDKKMSSLLIKNDWIKISKMEVAPGKEVPMHKGGKRLIIALSDYSLEFREDGSETIAKNWKRGEVHWHQAKMHSVKNIGTTSARFMILTKLEALPAMTIENKTHKHKDMAQLPIKIFENDEVIVSEAILNPGKKQPKHAGGIRAVVALSDYEILYNSDCVKNRKSTIKNESVHLHDADNHSVNNVGKTDAHFLIVQFKK